VQPQRGGLLTGAALDQPPEQEGEHSEDELRHKAPSAEDGRVTRKDVGGQVSHSTAYRPRYAQHKAESGRQRTRRAHLCNSHDPEQLAEGHGPNKEDNSRQQDCLKLFTHAASLPS
jgi:hypothetical protein